jgi:hypothetical protein
MTPPVAASPRRRAAADVTLGQTLTSRPGDLDTAGVTYSGERLTPAAFAGLSCAGYSCIDLISRNSSKPCWPYSRP